MEYFDKEKIKRLNGQTFWHPMAHPKDMQANPPIVIAQAQGTTLTDIDGHQTIDMVGGLWCVNLGYSCQSIKQAITEQLDTLAFFNSFRGTSNPRAIEAAEHLKDFFQPEGLSKVFFTNSGSESMDTALRLARQYQNLRGLTGKTKFISLTNAYHGTNFGGASIAGMARFRQNYEPVLPGCYQVPAPSLYRNIFNETDHDKLGELSIMLMKSQIEILGKESVCAVIMEPVLGSGGVYPPPKNFMPEVRRLCDQNDILLIADEVITAFGRTGAWTGSRLWNVKPDILTMAKGITNGYFPLGAVMLNDKIAEAFSADSSGTGTVNTGYTYSGHPVGTAAAIAAMKEFQQIDLPKLATDKGQRLMQGLTEVAGRHRIVGDVRGIGLMRAVELVSDPDTKQALDKKSLAQIYNDMYRAGTTVRLSGNCLFFSPALVIEDEQIDRSLEHLDDALSKCQVA